MIRAFPHGVSEVVGLLIDNHGTDVEQLILVDDVVLEINVQWRVDLHERFVQLRREHPRRFPRRFTVQLDVEAPIGVESFGRWQLEEMRQGLMEVNRLLHGVIADVLLHRHRVGMKSLVQSVGREIQHALPQLQLRRRQQFSGVDCVEVERFQ